MREVLDSIKKKTVLLSSLPLVLFQCGAAAPPGTNFRGTERTLSFRVSRSAHDGESRNFAILPHHSPSHSASRLMSLENA